MVVVLLIFGLYHNIYTFAIAKFQNTFQKISKLQHPKQVETLSIITPSSTNSATAV